MELLKMLELPESLFFGREPLFIENHNNFLRQAIAEIENLEPVWIPVTERLPDNHEWHLLLTGDGACHIAYYDMQRKKWVANSKFGKEPTHWMPLPQPPN